MSFHSLEKWFFAASWAQKTWQIHAKLWLIKGGLGGLGVMINNSRLDGLGIGGGLIFSNKSLAFIHLKFLLKDHIQILLLSLNKSWSSGLARWYARSRTSVTSCAHTWASVLECCHATHCLSNLKVMNRVGSHLIPFLKSMAESWVCDAVKETLLDVIVDPDVIPMERRLYSRMRQYPSNFLGVIDIQSSPIKLPRVTQWTWYAFKICSNAHACNSMRTSSLFVVSV